MMLFFVGVLIFRIFFFSVFNTCTNIFERFFTILYTHTHTVGGLEFYAPGQGRYRDFHVIKPSNDVKKKKKIFARFLRHYPGAVGLGYYLNVRVVCVS